MINEILQTCHLSIGILTGAAAALLGLMFWNSSVTNQHPFTTLFLKLLSVMTAAKVTEIVGAMYRAARIEPDSVPIDAAAVALVGRSIELALYLVMVWFLLRPETKKALNGATQSAPEEPTAT